MAPAHDLNPVDQLRGLLNNDRLIAICGRRDNAAAWKTCLAPTVAGRSISTRSLSNDRMRCGVQKVLGWPSIMKR